MAEETKKRPKRPTAQKRLLQDEKKRLKNRVFKSQVRTAIRAFHESVTAGEKETIQKNLQSIYSLMDKGVGRGIFKKNAASRTKSRLTAHTK